MALKFSLPKKGVSLSKIDLKKLYPKLIMLALIIGFILLCISIYFIVFDINRNNNSVTTKATVNQVDFNGSNYIISISYTANNQPIEQTIIYNAESVTVNDYIDIKYNKDNPHDLITTNHLKEIIIITPISLILLIGTTIIVLKKKNKEDKIARLKQTGILIYADIEGIFVNNNAKKRKGKLPYHIKAQYVNPQDSQVYTYVSEDYYEDLLMLTSSKTITKVPVYINPNNTSEYYMDLIYILPEEENEQK